MASVFDVADYFLAKTDPELGDIMTNLKIQKLAYYAQGFSVVILGRPLFDESIEAWEHGPVCPVLYRKYKGNKAMAIYPKKDIKEAGKPFTAKQRKLLDDIYKTYGCFAAWSLRDITHQDTAWHNAYPNGVISLEAMKESCEARMEEE
jgi:uncharacterized phage-associated protein